MERMLRACPSLGGLVLALLLWATTAVAQTASPPLLQPPPTGAPPQAPAPMPQPAPAAAPATGPVAKGLLYLSAVFGNDNQPVKSGLHWRVFNAQAEADGTHALVAESTDPTPTLSVPNGEYIVHAAFGLAGMTKRVAVNGRPAVAKLTLNAGALRIVGVLGDRPIPPNRLAISVYVPERGNSEAKLVVENATAGEILLLPEGTYHIVSTYLDTVGVGSLEPAGAAGNASNSVVTADIRVQAGMFIETTLRHRAAVLTLKLVNTPNGEALTDTTFTVLTPGGDVIRELIGAFPSLVLAEGDYIAIARHGTNTYPAQFKVQSGLDRDIEILAQSQPQSP
ncbi:MAG: hypothetical protein JO273_04635 [Methylobacteriaceae bacterium]|nr:hypothetical protein [Methylobacteriaceae bacterium]